MTASPEILRTDDGRYRATVRVASLADGFNKLSTKRFTAADSDEVIRAWETAERARLRAQLAAHRKTRAAVATSTTGFRYDAIEQYLPAVQAMPDIKGRVRDILLWVDEFRDRDRHSITALEIRTVRDRWLTVGPKRKWQKINGKGQWIDVAEPLAASTVNHRLRALSNLFTVLDPQQANVVHQVPEAAEPDGLPRAIDYKLIRSILDAMADRGRPVKKGEKRPTESLAKVRARVMAWTGIEPTELGRIPEHAIVDAIKTGFLIVPGRRKGAGAPGRAVPLNPDGIGALKDLIRLKACGRFSRRSVLRAWQIACVKKIGRPLRLKDLRHSYATKIVDGSKDLKTAQVLLGHQSHVTTQRYAMIAMLPLLRASFDAAFDKETTE